MKKTIGLLVFDLDGTLINSLDDLANSVHFTLKQMGLPPKSTEEVRFAVGDGVKVLLLRCMPSESAERLDEALSIFHAYYKEHCNDATYIYEGVIDLLNEYADTPKAILTNKNYQPTIDILTHLGVLHHFTVIVGGDTFDTRKPDPKGLQFIIEKIGCIAKETIMIGDGLPDIEVAKNAGVTSIALLDGITDKERLLALNPDFTVTSFSELRTLLGKSFEVQKSEQRIFIKSASIL